MKTIESLPLSNDQNPWPVWKLVNDTGASVTIMSWGATVLEIKVPDRNGDLNDVALGFNQLCDYRINAPKLGSVVGPYANRINNGQFRLNDDLIQLERNNNGHHLHGGSNGLHSQLWALTHTENHATYSKLELHCHLNKNVSGYPANYDIYVSYTWNDRCELTIEYRAKVSHDSIINLTQHSYFNLSGVEKINSIAAHQLWINSDNICELNDAQIPTDRFQSTQNTSLDFTQLRAISSQSELEEPQIHRADELDYNWIFECNNSEMKLMAALYEPHSQRHLRVFSDQPGLQIYSGNFLDGEAGKYQQTYSAHTGLCLETQHYPDSPNHPNFPSTILRKQDEFKSATIYQFGVAQPAMDAESNQPILY